MTRYEIFVYSVVSLAISLVPWISGQEPKTMPAQVEQPKSVHQMFLEDQADLPTIANGGVSKITGEEYNQRCAVRRAQIRSLLAAGAIKTGEDYYDAAFIFQHGEAADDYLFAHVLAMDAVVKGYDTAKWIAAATLDRYLQKIDKPQIFGTQYPLDPNAPHPEQDPHLVVLTGRTLAPYDEQLLPDAMRLDFCVPNVAHQKQNVDMFNAAKRPTSTMLAPGCKR